MSRPIIIAYYLPQYHPTPDNDIWWGKGFTEWTNVGKARPLFHHHYQPKVPADLGYYDLRLPEVREQQVTLAKEAGVNGFCYYHYWFGNGRQVLERPFNEVIESGKPDFPFCLCWANESWHSKFWNVDGTVKKKLLVEQTYPGDKDIVQHFENLLPAFKDNRYIKVNGKPVFVIYQPTAYETVNHFIEMWHKLAKKHGLSGIYFIGHVAAHVNQTHINQIKNLGFDAVNVVRMGDASSFNHRFARALRYLRQRLLKLPHLIPYKKIYPELIGEEEKRPDVFPTLIPNWDHSPRSKRAALVLTNSTPELFQKHVQQVLDVVKDKSDNNIVFLKSWNEWGEGNYMEPDLKYGHGYINALKKALEKL